MKVTRYNLGVDSGQMAVCPVAPDYKVGKSKGESTPVLRGASGGRCDVSIEQEKGRVKALNVNFNAYGRYNLGGKSFVVADPCYIYKDEFMMDSEPTGLPYDTACRQTCDTPEQAGRFPVDIGTHEVQGFATSTGWGDGVYPIEVTTNNEGDVIDIRMDFMEDADSSFWDEDSEDYSLDDGDEDEDEGEDDEI